MCYNKLDRRYKDYWVKERVKIENMFKGENEGKLWLYFNADNLAFTDIIHISKLSWPASIGFAKHGVHVQRIVSKDFTFALEMEVLEIIWVTSSKIAAEIISYVTFQLPISFTHFLIVKLAYQNSIEFLDIEFPKYMRYGLIAPYGSGYLLAHC